MKKIPSMMVEKLGLFGSFKILREALEIPLRYPNFITFSSLTCFPMFCTLVVYEYIIHQTLIEAKSYLRELPPYSFPLLYGMSMKTATILSQKLFHRLLQLMLFYLLPLHLFDLLGTITTVDLASKIHTGETPSSLKEMLHRSITQTRLKGPLITSIYVLLLFFLSLLAIVWITIQYLFILCGRSVVYTVLSGVALVVVQWRWLEFSAIWNMGIVISVLEERHGFEALAFSMYLSRSSRRLGFLLMLVFFSWSFGISLLCLYLTGTKKFGAIVVVSIHGSLFCLGNVMKWVVCMVYFYHCKKLIVEKKVDAEEGKK